jgi:exosome complex exonuclease DIS3/RRP44
VWCSLRGGVDRLAFSVLWEMTEDLEVVDVIFTKSVIHSRAAMTYQDAQELIDGTPASDELMAKMVGTTDEERLATKEQVVPGLRELMRIAKVLRQRRCVVAFCSGLLW